MRRVSKKIFSSVKSLLGSGRDDSAGAVNRIEAVRQSMLECLGPSGCAAFPVLVRRVSLVADIKGLWYLRPELMNALAAVHGELIARTQIRDLSLKFEGLLPGGFYSRPSALGD